MKRKYIYIYTVACADSSLLRKVWDCCYPAQHCRPSADYAGFAAQNVKTGGAAQTSSLYLLGMYLLKNHCYWKAQRDRKVSFSVSFCVNVQRMLGSRVDRKWDSVVCSQCRYPSKRGCGQTATHPPAPTQSWKHGADQSRDPGGCECYKPD